METQGTQLSCGVAFSWARGQQVQRLVAKGVAGKCKLPKNDKMTWCPLLLMGCTYMIHPMLCMITWLLHCSCAFILALIIFILLLVFAGLLRGWSLTVCRLTVTWRVCKGCTLYPQPLLTTEGFACLPRVWPLAWRALSRTRELLLLQGTLPEAV